MTAGKRTRLSASQRVEVWRRWKAGESLHAIGRALGKAHPVIHLLLKRHGGIAPAARRRSLITLTLAEREDISRGIACDSSIRAIAKGLDREASTASREVARHGGRPQYRANSKTISSNFAATGDITCIAAFWSHAAGQLAASGAGSEPPITNPK
jgi:IS30 family transposase